MKGPKHWKDEIFDREQFMGEDGYYYFKDTRKPVHRELAYKYIYPKDRKRYNKRFSDYMVHHIDWDKTNNELSNLQIVTPQKHADIHGWKIEYRGKTYYPESKTVTKKIEEKYKPIKKQKT